MRRRSSSTHAYARRAAAKLKAASAINQHPIDKEVDSDMHTTPLPKHPDGILRVLNIGRVSTPGQPQSNIDAGFEYGDAG